MRNTVKDNTLFPAARIWQPMIVSVLMVAVTACGEVDNSDGEEISSLSFPLDSSLTLFCPEAGIHREPCILNDPDNPYATTPVLAPNPDDAPNPDEEGAPYKWALGEDAPSWKSRFYLWATTQAVEPRGENQYHVALSLQGIYTESGSELAREQALKAYRSVLDNYFDDVWFFKFREFDSNNVFIREIVWPKKVRLLSVDNLWDDPADAGDNPLRDSSAGYPLTPLFTEELVFLQTLGEWGYAFESDTGDIYRN